MMQLNFKVQGEGKPILIVHGLFGMLDNWQTVAKNLADSFKVYTIDARNHGRSGHSDMMDYEIMAEDLSAFIQFHHIHDPCVIGHSMGGKAVMQLAIMYPQLVSALVAVDVAPKAYPPGHLEILEALSSTNVHETEKRGEVESALLAKLHSLSVVRFLMKNLSRQSEGGFEWKMNLPVLIKNYENIIGGLPLEGTFSGPTLVIRGSRSSYVLDEDWPAIVQMFPSAQLSTIQDAGHWVHADQPLALMEVLRGFMA